jgi:hypothetical protein
MSKMLYEKPALIRLQETMMSEGQVMPTPITPPSLPTPNACGNGSNAGAVSSQSYSKSGAGCTNGMYASSTCVKGYGV